MILIKHIAFWVLLICFGSLKLVGQERSSDNDLKLKEKVEKLLNESEFIANNNEIYIRLKDAYFAYTENTESVAGLNEEEYKDFNTYKKKLFAFKHFEQAIKDGKGGEIFTRLLYKRALNIYPGKHLNDYKSRFNYLIQRAPHEKKY